MDSIHIDPLERSFTVVGIEPEYHKRISDLITANMKTLGLRSFSPIWADVNGFRMVLEADTNSEDAREAVLHLLQRWFTLDRRLNTERTRHNDRLVLQYRDPSWASI